MSSAFARRSRAITRVQPRTRAYVRSLRRPMAPAGAAAARCVRWRKLLVLDRKVSGFGNIRKFSIEIYIESFKPAPCSTNAPLEQPSRCRCPMRSDAAPQRVQPVAVVLLLSFLSSAGWETARPSVRGLDSSRSAFSAQRVLARVDQLCQHGARETGSPSELSAFQVRVASTQYAPPCSLLTASLAARGGGAQRSGCHRRR